ncbi:AzlC family ABC transporter permease [Corynebacterium nasicanis]|uniref:AzlC family ABC transporter permease n=1 Tax=Corynebacterium nasicanis TaxID=1448267 RepID=A0ABW1QDB4_9CORY
MIAQIRAGIRDSWAVALGLIPLGLAFGLLVTQMGFAWWWAPIFSLLIYAGSMEFLALNLVTAGVGPVSAAITAFMVNFRHLFYGLTFPRDLVRSGPGRAYSTYALTDESYAIASARHPDSGVQVLTIQGFCQSMWVLSGIVGSLVGVVIPAGIQGMEFALVALFVVLVWETFRNNRDLSLLLISGGLAVVSGGVLMIALSAYFLLLLARHLFPTLDRLLEWRV